MIRPERSLGNPIVFITGLSPNKSSLRGGGGGGGELIGVLHGLVGPRHHSLRLRALPKPLRPRGQDRSPAGVNDLDSVHHAQRLEPEQAGAEHDVEVPMESPPKKALPSASLLARAAST